MRKHFYLILLIFLTIGVSGAPEIFAQKSKEPSKNSALKSEIKTQKQNPDISPPVSPDDFEKEILDEINAARQNPLQYSAYLEDLRQYYKDKTFTFPNRIPVLTVEGATGIDDAVANLKIAKPSDALKLSDLIHRATNDHLQDILKTGKFSHKGSDDSMPDDRLGKYVDVNTVRFGENLVMSRGGARDVVLYMLIDDGIPSRSHRRNILDPEFQFVGISSAVKDKSDDERYNVLIFSTDNTPKK